LTDSCQTFLAETPRKIMFSAARHANALMLRAWCPSVRQSVHYLLEWRSRILLTKTDGVWINVEFSFRRHATSRMSRYLSICWLGF